MNITVLFLGLPIPRNSMRNVLNKVCSFTSKQPTSLRFTMGTIKSKAMEPFQQLVKLLLTMFFFTDILSTL